MKLSIMIPVYDDVDEALSMVDTSRRSLAGCLEPEFLLVDLGRGVLEQLTSGHDVSTRILRASSLPAAKNLAAEKADGEFLLFLYPGIFPVGPAIETLLKRLEHDPGLSAVAGRWSNAAGKLEIGYNLRRFPTFTAMLLDILLLNKLFPRNAWTRRYKMHDFSHDKPVFAEHANDCVFMVRKDAIARHGGFDECYAPGWFDQVEFCQALHLSKEAILYEPSAQFRSNSNVPVIDRIVRDRYPGYRRAERLYVRQHFGRLAEAAVRLAIAAGMLQRLGFSLVMPALARKWFLSKLRSYVDDGYIQGLRSQYWVVLKETVGKEP